ncbi:MAG: NYN domain-containing protein [Bacteroides sp.]|nr:NYN domain-containing protein [Bacillota bacterium]MCM1394327.1 NYN domain-containing protein [[Eubacterium] siraeum]MCM1455154.1 NYN domain-containing protein [Bacteroides sp.]
MASKKYVVLADIESVRVPYTVFASALEELSQLGEIAACKFYGYSAKRTKDYGEFIQENSYDALSALPKKRKGKLDLRQVIDAARLAQFPNIDGFFIIYGNGDITPLIAYLKAYGKDVVAGVIEDDKNSKLCNKVIYLKADEGATTETVLNSGYVKVEPTVEEPVAEEPKQPEPTVQPEPKKEEPKKEEPAPAKPAKEDDDYDPQMALLLEEFKKILNG